MSERHLTSADSLPPQKDGVLRLYSMPYCPFAQRTRLVLAHKQIGHEIVNIHLLNKPTWFLEKNPNGAVPVLEFGDKILYESAICMEYLDETYPGPKLTPSDPYIKARGRILCEHFSKVIAAYYKCIHSQLDGTQAAAVEGFHKALATFEKMMPDTPFLTGNAVSMTDYSCWPWAERFPTLKEVVDLDPLQPDLYPKVCSWYEKMADTPGVKATRTSIADLSLFPKNYFNKDFDLDFAMKRSK